MWELTDPSVINDAEKISKGTEDLSNIINTFSN